MKIVYICSPFRGDTETNIKVNCEAREGALGYANAQQPRLSSLAPSGQFTLRYSRFAVEQGVLPIAPHLLFPQFLNDDNSVERSLAMDFNQTILHLCEEVWVFGNSTTMGMAFEIAFAKQAGISLKYFDSQCQEVEK